MKPRLHFAGLLALAALFFVDAAFAHSGRRFTVEVVGGKLQAQGVNTGPDDGAPAIRPYLNSIHGHWSNVDSLGIATATLPGFDITPSAATALVDHRLDLEWIGTSKWVAPPMMPAPGTVPVLETLAAGQQITIQKDAALDSDSLGVLSLADPVPLGGALDIDLVYAVNELPVGEIHVLRFRMHATPLSGGPSAVASSDLVHVLLSPDGSTPMERLHHASLYLEAYVAAIPEPSTLVGLIAGGLAAFTRRRQARCRSGSPRYRR